MAEGQALPNIRPKIEIDLKEYGKEGTIVMSKPPFTRRTAIQNTTLAMILTVDDMKRMEHLDKAHKDEIINQRMLENMMTVQAVTVLGCVESAPFHINDYQKVQRLDYASFTRYMDEVPGLFEKMSSAMSQLEGTDPLANSTPTVQQN